MVARSIMQCFGCFHVTEFAKQPTDCLLSSIRIQVSMSAKAKFLSCNDYVSITGWRAVSIRLRRTNRRICPKS